MHVLSLLFNDDVLLGDLLLFGFDALVAVLLLLDQLAALTSLTVAIVITRLALVALVARPTLVAVVAISGVT